MPADRVHLVRHGEVHNPAGVLYGRLPGFRLSELGGRMARAAAEAAHDDPAGRRPVARIVASPLQRTRESAAPWSELFGIPVETDARVIEPYNSFEGKRVREEVRRPRNWMLLSRPWEPSWGEPFARIADRMLRAMSDAAEEPDDGDVVIVSHQLPIWVAHLAVTGRRLSHDPRRRRCALSSVTTFERTEGGALDPGSAGRRGWREVGYAEPAGELLAASVDLGAV